MPPRGNAGGGARQAAHIGLGGGARPHWLAAEHAHMAALSGLTLELARTR